MARSGAGARPVGAVEEAPDERLDQVFFALSDPVRRRILERLGEEPLLVSELAAPFDISLQAVSRHIQVLVRAGLVRQERTGRVSRCRLDAGPIFGAAVWINRYSKYWQEQFDALAEWLGRTGRTRAKAPHPRRGGPRSPGRRPGARRPRAGGGRR
jgi:DNA-binding transcriptional ArsR family regulator